MLLAVQAHGSAGEDVASLEIEVYATVCGEVSLRDLVALSWLLLVGLRARRQIEHERPGAGFATEATSCGMSGYGST